MPVRPPLEKIVFTYKPEDIFIDAVRDVIPEATIVTATADDGLTDEIVDARLTVGPGYDPEILARGSQLVWHHVPWAGVERVALSRMAEQGVVLTNSRGISAPNMAEHAIAFMLAFARAFPVFFRQQQQKQWRGWGDPPPFFELTGQTVVLLGTGTIGTAIATRLHAFGCRIVGVRRNARPLEGFDQIVSFDQLSSILPEADHVISSLPMTPFTSEIVDRDFIERMKPGSYFYNLGRGGTVDQEALIAALHSGHLAGAGLDVTDPEPLPEDSPLWDAPNTIITGHTSGNSPMYIRRGADVFRENLRRYIAGEELFNVVDLEYGY